jgi:hypothetical protein
MGIRFHCHHCRHELHVKDFQGGKKGRCPECQGKFRIPLRDAELSLEVDAPAAELVSTASAVSTKNSATRTPQSTASSGLDAPHKSAAQGEKPPATQPRSKSEPSRPSQNPTTSQTAGRRKATESSSPDSAKSKAAATVTAAAAHQPTELAQTTPSQPTPAQDNPAKSAAVQPNTESLDTSEPKLPAAIADQPQATWHVRPVTGGQYGPAPADIMGQWLIEGRVPRDALVWRDDWPEWQVAGDALSDYFGKEPAVIAAGPTPTATSSSADSSSAGSNSAVLNSAASTTPLPVTAGGRSRLERKQKKRQRYILIVSILSVLFVALVAALLIVLLAPSK